jgi:hypothetical protein
MVYSLLRGFSTIDPAGMDSLGASNINNDSPLGMDLGLFLLDSDFDFLSEMMPNRNKTESGVGGSDYALTGNQVNENETGDESAPAASQGRLGITKVPMLALQPEVPHQWHQPFGQ